MDALAICQSSAAVKAFNAGLWCSRARGIFLLLLAALVCATPGQAAWWSYKHKSFFARRSLRESGTSAKPRELLAPMAANTVPLCMPMSSACVLNSAYLLHLLGSVQNLTVPQLLFAQEAAASVVCPAYVDEKSCVTGHPFCKWDPDQMYCDINPSYLQDSMFCPGSKAQAYFQCIERDVDTCASPPGSCFLSNSTDGTQTCLPSLLANATSSEVLAFSAAIDDLPLDPEVYGCCPGMALYSRYQSCAAFRSRTTCNSATAANNATCRWDMGSKTCTVDAVRLIIETFGEDAGAKLAEKSSACANIPLARCASQSSFDLPAATVMQSVLGMPLNNTGRCPPLFPAASTGDANRTVTSDSTKVNGTNESLTGPTGSAVVNGNSNSSGTGNGTGNGNGNNGKNASDSTGASNNQTLNPDTSPGPDTKQPTPSPAYGGRPPPRAQLESQPPVNAAIVDAASPPRPGQQQPQPPSPKGGGGPQGAAPGNKGNNKPAPK